MAKRAKLKLVIKTGNAAMLTDHEVGHALRKVADRMDYGAPVTLRSYERDSKHIIRDINGQPVGYWKVTS